LSESIATVVFLSRVGEYFSGSENDATVMNATFE
jgi:hypothetical protein